MDLKILQIASNTENNKVIKDHTHKATHKNAICGDQMEISLKVKENKIVDFGYQCKSCVYCQAAVSLLSRKVIQLSMNKVLNLLSDSNLFFDKNKDINKNTDEWKDFKKIMNINNIARKECLLLPFKTLSKALKL